jgi:D-alanine-D-alanine ligase
VKSTSLPFRVPEYRPVPAHTLEQVKILFIAKHVFWQGGLHHADGNHAVYHLEIRSVLERIGFDLSLADSYEALFAHPGCDFVFPLLNRGGFLNSEILLPLLCTRLGIPFLGATPILRGLSDDKHLTKLEACARGVPTAPWAIYRRGAPIDESACPMAERMVVKPNASSASWGVRDAGDWAGVKEAVAAIHDDGHDAIVEPFLKGSDIEVPVITADGACAIMPMMLFEQADPAHLRTYDEKRDLVDRSNKYNLVAFENPGWQPKVAELTQRMAAVFHPFDYGRFEFRFDEATGTLNFLEVNLNCNLWSEKVFGRSAALAGMSHDELIETIVGESLIRHGLTGVAREMAA